MKMASRSIDLISKNTNCTCSTLFSNQRKTNLHVQHAFCVSLPLFCTTTTLFCTNKSSNFLVTRYFYGGIVVTLFCLPCSYSYFSLPLIFTLLAASISHQGHLYQEKQDANWTIFTSMSTRTARIMVRVLFLFLTRFHVNEPNLLFNCKFIIRRQQFDQ